MTVGTRIKMARRAAGLNRKELAERTGLTPQYLSKLESNEQEVDVKTARNLARALDLDSTYFFGRSLIHSLAIGNPDKCGARR